MELKFLFITESKKMSDEDFEYIWEYFDTPFLRNLKYGIKEPAGKKYLKEDFKEVFTLIKNGLIIQGDNNLLLTINYRPYGTIEWRLNVDSSNYSEPFLRYIFDFIFLLNRKCKLIYGRGTSEIEFNEKHLEKKCMKG
jgi:hypothetical protein